MISMKTVLAIGAAALALGLAGVQAQTVVLTANDGSVSLSGTLNEFNGEFYSLNTSIGVLQLGVDSVSCEGEGCPDLFADTAEFSIAGSDIIGRQLMPALIEAYAFDMGGDLEIEALSNTQIKYTVLDANGEIYSAITLNFGTSNDAFAALESGAAYIGLSSRRVTDGERSRFIRAGNGNLTSPSQEHLLALDGLAVSVSQNNPIKILSLQQISDIFAGNITNWREVGGLDAAINVYRRGNETGATQVFEALVMDPNRQALGESAFIKRDSAAVSNAVAGDLNGIGITSLVEAGNARAIELRSVCGQVSSSSAFTVKTEEYPMSRRMFMYVNGGNLPNKVAEFVAYATSDAVQGIVSRTGFVNQEVSTASLNDQGRRLAHALLSEQARNELELLQEMVASLLDAERLSLTFRFKSGSVEPDNRAIVDIDRLAEMVKRGDFEGKRLLIIGFADSIGAINENQRLSQARAESVRDVLVSAVGFGNLGSVQFTPFGYGKLSPIGCNETEDGRDTNRRVEIWVR